MLIALISFALAYEEPPITVNNPTLTTQDLGQQYFSDENQAVQAIVSNFPVDGNAAWNFINKLKYASRAKTSFFKFEMGVNTDQTWRNALMKVALVSGRRENGAYVLRSIIVNTNTAVNAYYVEVHKKKKRFMGIKVGSKTRVENKWRPLKSHELQQVYSALQTASAGTVSSIASQI